MVTRYQLGSADGKGGGASVRNGSAREPLHALVIPWLCSGPLFERVAGKRGSIESSGDASSVARD